MQNTYWLHDSGSGKRPSALQINASVAIVDVGASVVVVVRAFGQMYPTVQRASVGLKFDPAGHRKVYSWNVVAAVCKQYLYVWQSGCSGFGKRPDVMQVKTLGAAVVTEGSEEDS